MKKQLSILLAGVMILAPLAVTAWAIVWTGGIVDSLGSRLLPFDVPPGVGAVVLIAMVYLVGLLTRVWLFTLLIDLMERLVTRVPGIKTLYESVRDLLGLFGGDAEKMGKVVQYTPPGSDMILLGIRTSDRPPYGAVDPDRPTVAVYLPFSYMFGGITVYCEPGRVREIDMPVEQCLKLCATAFVGGKEQQSGDPERETPE